MVGSFVEWKLFIALENTSVYSNRQAPHPRFRWECRGQDWPRYFGHNPDASKGLKSSYSSMNLANQPR